MAGTITSNNAAFTLAIAGLFAVPQQLQGFAADDIFDTEGVEPAETSMGVDGKLSAGLVFAPVKQSVALQADSDSNTLFEAWYAAQKAAGDVYYAQGSVYLPATGRAYVMTRGVLTAYSPMPDAKKTLQPRKYGLTWESVTGAPA